MHDYRSTLLSRLRFEEMLIWSKLNEALETGIKILKNGGSSIDAVEKTINVMENSPHVLLSGKGALEFAREQGVEMVDSSYFYTERRWKALQKALAEKKFGTVGCVALDKAGNLAAGTSTGGMINKNLHHLDKRISFEGPGVSNKPGVMKIFLIIF